MTKDLNQYSRTITQDPSLPAAQAMLHALGLTPQDLQKPQIGIASTGWEGNPCNMHLNGLAKEIKTSVEAEDLLGLIFHTIGVSDGMSMGTTGMRYSLPSRDIIADSIETVASAQWYDGLITVVGCDKNMPGAMIALGRLDRPSILFYGGTIAPGCHKGRDLTIVSAFEALGELGTGSIDQEEFQQIIQSACPGPGACGGMYTANTMSSAIEAMGMSLPYNGSIPAVSNDKKNETSQVGEYMKNLLELDLTPRRIVTRQSLINALRLITVLGGSTNAVIHMLAIARAFGLELDLSDFQDVSRDTPLLADLKPSGAYVMQDLHQVGGIPAVMKLMLTHDLLDGNQLTVTGKTIAENLETVNALHESQKVIMPVDKPIYPQGHLRILYGNLASQGSVAKITGKEGHHFQGPVLVYDSEAEANEALSSGKVAEGSVVVIRYCGPKGGPGMPEMLKPTSLLTGAGLEKTVALITDGRFSGGSHGFVVGHVVPEAYDGGLIALLRDGDIVTIDALENTIHVDLTDSQISERRTQWKAPEELLPSALRKYRRLVQSASEGCITDA